MAVYRGHHKETISIDSRELVVGDVIHFEAGMKAPADCLVIEDSHNGMHAAHAAGMEVLAVPNRLTSILDFSQAAWFAESLSELISSDTAQPGS